MTPSTTARDNDTLQAIRRLDEINDKLSGLIEIGRNALEPVLRHDEPSPQRGDRLEAPMEAKDCPLASNLHSRCNALVAHLDALERLINRVTV